MYRHVLVTGGAGFAGAALAVRLKQQFSGLRVTALDNLKRRGSERNLDTLKFHGIDFVHGDIRNREDLESIAVAPDLVIECSAEPSVQAGYGGSSPAYLVNTNLTGCYHCLDMARLWRPDFVFLSTSRVYPYLLLNSLRFVETDTRYEMTDDQPMPGASASGVSEAFPLQGPKSLYGMTKLASELMVEEFADAYNFRFLINRFGVLTGPGQWGKSDQGVIAWWVASHLYGRPLRYIGFGGSGKQVRDFLHIDDFCDLLIDQLTHFDQFAGRCWNAGGGRENSLSLLEATQLCREVTGRETPVTASTEERPADVRMYVTDATAVKAVRGWKPLRDARTTLSDIARWMVEGGDDVRRTLGF